MGIDENNIIYIGRADAQIIIRRAGTILGRNCGGNQLRCRLCASYRRCFDYTTGSAECETGEKCIDDQRQNGTGNN
nr:MAG TPA_asm: hypothetical protein [Caudoviricetes sp.]